MLAYEVKYGKMKMVKCMNSRMDKYYKEKEEKNESRTNRHRDMYSEVEESNYEKLNLTSNVKVIKTNADLNIDNIKEIIDEKYEKRRNPDIEVESFESDYENIDEEDTKEYDLKKVIETAHKNKKPNYDRERFEHLRESQYDILNSLNIIGEKEYHKSEALSQEEATLMNLIKTVNDNAEKNHSNNEGDLLEDLMGSDNTEVLEPVTIVDDEDIEYEKKPTILEELEKTKQLSRSDIEEELEKEKTSSTEEDNAIEADEIDEPSENKITLSKTEELSNSFYTGKYQINKRDMDDFMDLEKEMKGGSLVVKILIIVIVLITIALAVYLLNKYLNLGLF